jgi:hypothetical protein
VAVIALLRRRRTPARKPSPVVAVFECPQHGKVDVYGGYLEVFREGESFEVECVTRGHYLPAIIQGGRIVQLEPDA